MAGDRESKKTWRIAHCKNRCTWRTGRSASMTNILLVIQTFFEALSGAERDLHDQAPLEESASHEKMMRAQMRQLERLRYGAAWRRQTSILLSSVVWFRE